MFKIDLHDGMIISGLALVFTGLWQLTSVWHALTVVGGLILVFAIAILLKG